MAYDVIVIGVGSMGSSTCYQLAKSGVKVLGIEQFDITHEQGSHTGQSRMIRKAYFEHPDYVPLLHKSYEGWSDLEKETRMQFYWETGIAYFGEEDAFILNDIRQSASTYNLKLESFDHEQVAVKWPQFNIPKNYQCLFEPEAGFVTPERAILTYVDLARALGAEIHAQEEVLTWEMNNNTVKVITNKGEYKAGKIIFTAGAFTDQLLPLKVKLKVTQQYLSWVEPNNQFSYRIGDFPSWMIVDKNQPGPYYGFPQMPAHLGGTAGIKLGIHRPGEPFTEIENKEALAQEDALLNTMLTECFNDISAKISTIKACKYTYSPDENFIVDVLSEYDNRVVVACGFSGHGFKFAPVIGEALADLALNGASDLPVDFLRLTRFV